MEIPYTTHARPDTGLTNPKLGIWLFLASEVMLFGSLFSSYALLRSGATTWPQQSDVLSVPLAALNTVVLIASSVTMVLAWASLKNKSVERYRLFMGLTILGGAIFLVVKTIEYSEKFSHHLYPATSNFLGLYFTLTGLHALHADHSRGRRGPLELDATGDGALTRQGYRRFRRGSSGRRCGWGRSLTALRSR